MADFEIVDLSETSSQRGGTRGGSALGRIDSNSIAESLKQIAEDLDPIFEEKRHLQLKTLVLKLTVTAEGGVAFIAKGSAEASIELTFERPTE